MEVPRPTPYPDVNAVIHEILSGASAVLGNDLVGMYLTGSLAAGDFDPENSDIDLLYTLEHGTVVSKPVAAGWTRTAYGARWDSLIDRALAWVMRWNDVQTTLDLLRYTLDRCRQG